ncbi:unnamed protein product [Rotaria sordida]|uniref:Proteasome activator complex subunit 4 n=1 Tax=Rotaria sordida TaxID=392033 RepID=A0A814M0Y6_9BILA|nr:unnamed protein product [Rotaria sordida]
MLSLPVGNLSIAPPKDVHSIPVIASWIVAMMGNGSLCLQYVRDSFTAIKSFYHPSNMGDFQEGLIQFLVRLTQSFVDRVHLESKADRLWQFNPPPSYRLTEQDITDFVNCVKECVFISIFNKTNLKDAAKAFRNLAMLRPELVVSPIVEQLFSSVDMSNARTVTNVKDDTTEIELTSVVTGIVQQCSSKIFQVVREKIMNFLVASSFTPRVSKLLTDLVQPILEANPIETLKYLMPQTCERIEKIVHDSETTILTDHKGDMELTWCLILFSKLLEARGDTLLIYKSMILSVFHRCIHIIHKESYEAVAYAAKNLLQSLSYVYPIDYRLTVENIDEPFIDFLPIRAWGQPVEFDKLQPQFHIPSPEEVDFACEFVETFIYPELTLLNEKSSNMSNDERLRSLTIVHFIALGCLRMVPRIESEEVLDFALTVAPVDFKYKAQYTVCAKEPKFKENLRMRLIIDIGKLLANDYAKLNNDFDILKYSFENKLSGRRYHPRFVIIKRLAKEIQSFSIDNYQSLTKIDKQVILKLVELSINRYSQVRCIAQIYLFTMLQRYVFSYNVVVDRILGLLNAPGEADHDEIKGCLYVLLGDDAFFLPTKHSWPLLEKLWPSIARTTHATKISTQILIDQIVEKITKQFDIPAIIEDTNAISIRAAVALWRPLELKEVEIHDQIREEHNQANIQSYNNLMETLNLICNNDRLTWRQQERTVVFISLLLQKHVPIPSSCIRTFSNFLVHDNVKLRMGLFRNFGSAFVDHFMEQLYALIREKIIEIQEGSQRVAAEIVAGMIRGSKYWTLDELWSKLTPFLNELCMNLSSEAVLNWGCCFWFAVADVDPRRTYHTVEFMRSLINTPSTANTFIETSRWNLVDQLRNFEWRIPGVWHEVNAHAKDLLEHPYKAVRECIASVLGTSLSHDITLPNGQSIRHPSVNLFFDGIHERLQRAIDICEKAPLEAFIEQIEYVCKSSKWHARRAAIEFVQHMIFCVLGLCAIVLSSPYDIPIHIPRALMLLCEHSHDPNLIRKSIKNALSEFRRTHHDSWHEHREKFTEDQLVILADVLISPNYYA